MKEEGGSGKEGERKDCERPVAYAPPSPSHSHTHTHTERKCFEFRCSEDAPEIKMMPLGNT